MAGRVTTILVVRAGNACKFQNSAAAADPLLFKLRVRTH